MKAREAQKVSTLRLLMTALKNERIALQKDLTDAETLTILQREAKRRREAIDAFRKGGRDDLAAKERAELEILSVYLPEQMDESAITDVVAAIIQKHASTGTEDFGRIMGLAMKELKGKADGALVQSVVKKTLEKQTG